MRVDLEKVRIVRSTLASWGPANFRPFPWRQDRIGYSVYVAEVLLQQTFAAKVVSVYNAFVLRYPNYERLAAADIRTLKRLIKPLGLPFRAEILKKTARRVTSEFNGETPKDRGSLVSLHGVGDYIADAVLCYAFGEKVIPIDTNVNRVIGRLFGITYPHCNSTDKAEVKAVCSALAKRVRRPASLNYAILDFAAGVCTFYKPACLSCPLRMSCCYYLKSQSAENTNVEPNVQPL